MGLVTTSGSLGLLLVPSVPLILYGVIAQQLDVGEFTIVELFIAGVVPLCLMLSLLIHGRLASSWRRDSQGSFTRATQARVRMPAGSCPYPLWFLRCLAAFLRFQSLAVTAAYVILAEVLLYKEVAWRQHLLGVESMVMVGTSADLVLLGVYELVDAEVPQQLLVFINQYIEDPQLDLAQYSGCWRAPCRISSLRW